MAAKDGVRLAVQVKVKGGFTKEEKEKLLKWAKRFEAKPILATKRRGRWIFKDARGSSAKY